MATRTGTDVALAAKLLQEGGLVGIPTETVYGLAANGLDAVAVARIFEAKHRPSFDPLILHTHSLEAALGLVSHFPPKALQLAQLAWPGPLTLVLPRQPHVPDLATSGLPTVGIRVPGHPLALALLRQLPFPLAAPSANPFGYISPTMAQHVGQQLGRHVAYVLDGGPCAIGLESTIIAFEGAEPVVLRLGGLPLEQIETWLGQHVKHNTHSSSNPGSPGLLASHYAPRTPFSLMPRATPPMFASLPFKKDEIGWLGFQTFLTNLPASHQRVLSAAGDVAEAAANLFRHMRELDAAGLRLICAEPAPAFGLGLAINDRLTRAAHR